MNKISAIIVARGNPPHIFETIKAVEDIAAEIIVVNIGIDKTLITKIANYNKIKIISIEKDVPYVELIREESKKEAKNEFILFLDPDEIVPEKLKSIVKENLNNYDYFSIPRKNIIFGKWICHSRWWPDYQVRLFKKDKVIWPTQIHYQPETKGKGLTIPAEEKFAIIHYNYENLDEYLTKAARYARSEAQNLIDEKNDFSLIDTIKKAVSEFISRYFAFEGYKDGMHGFVLSILQMFYYFLVYFYIWEKKGHLEGDEKLLPLKSQKLFKQGLKETNHWLIKKKLVSKFNSLRLKLINLLLE